MKYFYIICMFLSSFFTYKSLMADSLQYAFFMPGDAMQQSGKLNDLNRMRPRHRINQRTHSENNTNSQPNFINKQSFSAPDITTSEAQFTEEYQKGNKINHQVRNKKNIRLPVEPKKIIAIKKSTSSDKKATSQVISPSLKEKNAVSAAEVSEKLKKYKLDDNLSAPFPDSEYVQEIPEPTIISEEEQLLKMSVSDLLDRIPFADKKDPKFKQIYSYYGTELKILRNYGKLPINLNQEETLAKANSLRRFEVK